jgi:hypothetical protein
MIKDINNRDLSDIAQAVAEQKARGISGRSAAQVLTLDEAEGLIALAELGLDAEELANEFQKLLDGRIGARPKAKAALNAFRVKAQEHRPNLGSKSASSAVSAPTLAPEVLAKLKRPAWKSATEIAGYEAHSPGADEGLERGPVV